MKTLILSLVVAVTVALTGLAAARAVLGTPCRCGSACPNGGCCSPCGCASPR